MKNSFKGKDLLKVITEYPVNIPEYAEELREQIEKLGLEDDVWSWLSEQDIEDYDILYEAVDWDCGERIEEYEDMFIRPAQHYLVFAKGCRWNGASGYSITDSFDNAINRNYEHSMYITDVSTQGKWILFNECSHDVPTGNPTIIIALTDSEYKKLNDADFKKVQEFAELYM